MRKLENVLITHLNDEQNGEIHFIKETNVWASNL